MLTLTQNCIIERLEEYVQNEMQKIAQEKDSEISKLREELNRNREQLGKMKESHSNLASNIQENLSSLHAKEMKRLQQEKREIELVLLAERQRFEREKKEEMLKLQKQIGTLKKELLDAKSSEQELLEQTKESEKQLERLLDKQKKLENEKNDLLDSSNAQKEQLAKQKDNEINKLKADINNMQDRIHKANASTLKVQVLTKQLNQVQSQHSQAKEESQRINNITQETLDNLDKKRIKMDQERKKLKKVSFVLLCKDRQKKLNDHSTTGYVCI